MTLRVLERRLALVADRLAAAFGRPRRRRGDPLAELVATVLSQNTSDVNSTRAYRSLRTAFPSWQRLARARRPAIERAIRSGGLARTKSRRLLELLREVRARFSGFDLGALRRAAPAAAAAQLAGLPGVGPKTRACVLLFACGQPAFPVDTHVHRVARRLGLVPPETSAGRTQQLLEPAVPAGRHQDLHLNLIRLGRTLCRPRQPRCAACPLRACCGFARAAGARRAA